MPASHFGVILQWQQLDELAQRLKDKGVKFVIEPYVRFQGRRGSKDTVYL